MKFNILDQYNSFVENNFIKKDLKQVEVLKKINEAWNKNKKIFFSKNNKKGVYLHGGVGTGKTFLLNIFYQYTKVGKKIHFNHLMNKIHMNINNNKTQNQKLDKFIKEFCANKKILFIDELHIFNIVDALIIKKIFEVFEKYKIFILISSNYSPKDLYKDGLQRSDFVPFINLINNNFEVINYKSNYDYRRIALNQSKTYFTPINTDTKNEFKKLFERFIDKSLLSTKKIKTNSREIVIDNCTANVALCEFDSLCGANLAHEDYKNIAMNFSLLFIKNIPIFTSEILDKCRRFISLIDMLYEKNCSVVLLAEAPISSVCKVKKLSKEFERTESRLYEMTIIKTS